MATLILDSPARVMKEWTSPEIRLPPLRGFRAIRFVRVRISVHLGGCAPICPIAAFRSSTTFSKSYAASACASEPLAPPPPCVPREDAIPDPWHHLPLRRLRGEGHIWESLE